jgi:hypothetical protein
VKRKTLMTGESSSPRRKTFMTGESSSPRRKTFMTGPDPPHPVKYRECEYCHIPISEKKYKRHVLTKCPQRHNDKDLANQTPPVGKVVKAHKSDGLPNDFTSVQLHDTFDRGAVVNWGGNKKKV